MPINSWMFLGDIIYFNVLGQHYMILNTLESTTELFERRSTNYSDRTRMPMMVELYVSDPFHPKNMLKFFVPHRMNWDMSMGFLPYGQWWRRHRRSFHEYFRPNALTKYQSIQRREIQAFLRRLLVTPDNFFHLIRQ